MGLLDWIKQLFSNNKKNARIYATTFNKTYGEGDPLEVGLYEGTTPLANKKIIININGVNYERVTDENGIAKLNINLKVGEYKTLLTFNEDEIYNQTFRLPSGRTVGLEDGCRPLENGFRGG